MDDLDQLQQDLEKLLSSNAVRIRYLLSEIGEIDRDDDIHDRKAHDKVSFSIVLLKKNLVLFLDIFEEKTS